MTRSSATAQRLVLASASPRRRELLGQLGIDCRIRPADVDETPHPGESPADYVARVALDKGRAARATESTEVPVLAADTAVVLDDRILGKPRHEADAARMLAALSGRTHEVLSAVALLIADEEHRRLSCSRVTFRVIDAREIAAYWRTGEPADKAGGYAVQGLGAIFVAHLEGSYSGVMGLPLFETAELLALSGWQLSAEGFRDG